MINIYKDSQGNTVSLIELIRREPEWAANKINKLRADRDAARKRIAELESEIALCHQRENRQVLMEAK